MSHRPFRFVHASDFHLETPVEGVAEVPDHLREPLLEAPYIAAARVFDTVLAEEAEFLVLSGDILHPPQTGPRGPLFLAEQFARLAQRQIPVYWASGGVDPPEVWPTAIPLPENVHLAARGRVAELIHPRDGVPLARVLLHGRDGNRLVRAGDFNPDPAGLYTIAAVHGTVETAALGLQGIDYWALGGRHDRSTLFSTPRMAHYAGSPQGRRPDEAGLHGCTLVQVDENRQARTHLAPVDALRWLGERVVVDEATGRDELESLLRGRLQTLDRNHAEPGLARLVDGRRQRAADRPVAAGRAGRRAFGHAAERARLFLARRLERVDGGRAGRRPCRRSGTSKRRSVAISSARSASSR